MKIRTTIPKGNKYYIRKCSGGYSSAIAGYPTISGADVLCNCVGYAGSRFNEIIGKGYEVYKLVCNAENFIEAARSQGLKISAKPVQGGILVWMKGRSLSGGDGAGHVAVVEEVYEDGSILTSESGYGSRDWAFKNIHRNNSNGRWGQSSAYTFRGCIVNPAVDGKIAPTPKLTVDGVAGAGTIRALQEFLKTPQDGVISGQRKALKRYYPNVVSVTYGGGGSACVKALQKWTGTTADGIWGQGTTKALQKKLGVTVDGIAGSGTVKALQRMLNGEKPKSTPTTIDKEIDACKVQADWMKNFTYKWVQNPTIDNSKKFGTCVTYVACVLQRIGILKSGGYIWIDEKGKVFGTTNKMTVTYLKGTLASNKSKLKRGDIVIGGNGKTGAGQGSHIFVLTGKWDGDNPYIYDQDSASRVKNEKAPEHTWKGSFEIIALIRLEKPTKTVIDVSEFQPPIDWAKVKKAGVEGAIIRAGYRGASKGTIKQDARFLDHIKGAKAAGLQVGVYFFTQAITAQEGKCEADWTINTLQKIGIKPDYPIVIDTETVYGGRANGLGRDKRTECIKGFCEQVKARGYTPMIYASTSWLDSKLDMSKLPYSVWVAQYNDRCTYKGKYIMWQFTSTGAVSGVAGRVDMSHYYGEKK